LAFATHYGFRPVACRPRRSCTKGKIERQFDFVEKNLLNARIIIYGPQIEEIARHRLLPRQTIGETVRSQEHEPADDSEKKYQVLKERYAELGETAREGVRPVVRPTVPGRHGRRNAKRRDPRAIPRSALTPPSTC